MSTQQLLGRPAPGWQARVKEAAYTSASGTRVVFLFTSVSRVTPLRRAVFRFNDINGHYVQDNGHDGRDYPLICLFTGADHDIVATQFELAVIEGGIGRLEHPIYGTFPVIGMGTVTRRNDLVEDANQSVVEVTFSTTLAEVYPSGQGYPKSELEAQVAAFTAAAVDDFVQAVQLATVAQKANLKGTIRKLLADLRQSFDQVSGAVSGARRQLEDQHQALDEALDTLIGEPVLLAQQVLNFVQAPARILEGLASRVDGYGIMLARIFAQYEPNASIDTTTLENVAESLRNDFQTADLLFALGSISGSVLSIVDQSYQTRPEALKAADDVLEQLGESVAWRDERYETLGAGSLQTIDTGASYQAIQEAVAQAAGYLVETSFSLVPERAIVTDRARTILDLCAQLYGSVEDEQLDLLIASNDFGGDEILEVPMGRRVVYYVQAA
jgi:hypothetical protein